jgi:branched-chain amino acid aminotransferase
MIEVLTAWFDGEFVEPDEAALGAFDHAITVGDGLFEATKIVDGTPIALTRHLDRLERSAAKSGLTVPLPRAELDDACRAVAARTPGPAKLRLTVTAGVAALSSARGDQTGSVLIAAASTDPPPAAAAVTVVEWPRNERGALAGVKSTSYLENVVALTRAQEMGSDEAVFANTVGNLCEGTGSNVFVVVDGRLITPPLSSGPLAGVTRALVLDVSDAVEEDLPIEAFVAADEAFLTSCTRDVQPIGRIDGRALPDVPGPITANAAAAYLDLIATTPDP